MRTIRTGLRFHPPSIDCASAARTLTPRQAGKHFVQRILPRMGDHSGANASAPIGQNPEHRSVQADQNHHSEALVRVSPAKCCGRKNNASSSALSQCHELRL